MTKKLLFIIGTFCLCGAQAYADDSYSHLTFQNSDGTKVSMTASSLTMTFSDGKLIVTNGTDTKELTLADLGSMYFSCDETTGIKEVSITDADGEVEAFSLQGVSYGKYASLRSLNGALPAGVYVVKSNGKTQKITVR